MLHILHISIVLKGTYNDRQHNYLLKDLNHKGCINMFWLLKVGPSSAYVQPEDGSLLRSRNMSL